MWQTLCFIEITSVKAPRKPMGYWGLTSRPRPHPLAPRRDALAHATPAGFFSVNQYLDKIVLHRRDGRDEVETIAQSILRAVENNGEVTLPDHGRRSAHRWNGAFYLALTLVGLALLIFFSLR